MCYAICDCRRSSCGRKAPPLSSNRSLARLTNRSMTGTLNDLEYFCGIELCYHSDLRRVQLNLNEIPHAKRDPCVPADAIRRLFGSVPVERHLTVH